MKRLTTMNLDTVKSHPPDCDYACPFLAYLEQDTLRLVKKDRFHGRFSQRYTQLVMLLSPNHISTIPEEIAVLVKEFYEKVQAINLKQDRERIINVIKFTIFMLNKTIMEWNLSHPSTEDVYLNLTVAFIYGDQLVLFNFGDNLVYMYRDGDLSSFNGISLNTEMHFSLKTGQAGRVEYTLFSKTVPPIGKAKFESQQIMTLFKLSHRLLKDDILVLLTENSIDIPTLRVNVNLYEHTVERRQLLSLIKKSRLESADHFGWVVLSFPEVQELRQTVRYTFFRTIKGLLSYVLLLATLFAPIAYHLINDVDKTPVQAFDMPPTTAQVILIKDDDTNLLTPLPSLSSSPKEEDAQPDGSSISTLFSKAIGQWAHLNLASYRTLNLELRAHSTSHDKTSILEDLSLIYYDTKAYTEIIDFLNPNTQWETAEIAPITLPVFSEPSTTALSLSQISKAYYGSDDYADFLNSYNDLSSADPPYEKTIMIPPLGLK